jgi:protein ImuA
MRVDSPLAAAFPAAPEPLGVVPLGAARLDAALDGGLRADGLHEFHAAQPVDLAAALGFALLVARLRHEGEARPLIWARQDDAPGLPYGPGLIELGIDPDRVTLLALRDGKALLRAGLDCARDGAASAVLLELHGRQPLLDLTATRRLALAGAQSATMVLIARSNAAPSPSAAHSRWQVAAAPSQALPANAPGYPAFTLTLLRRRGGGEGLTITLEWNRDQTSFRESMPVPERAPLPGALPALASGGADDPRRRSAG